MDAERFDQLTKAMGRPVSRRSALQVLFAAVAGGALGIDAIAHTANAIPKDAAGGGLGGIIHEHDRGNGGNGSDSGQFVGQSCGNCASYNREGTCVRCVDLNPREPVGSDAAFCCNLTASACVSCRQCQFGVTASGDCADAPVTSTTCSPPCGACHDCISGVCQSCAAQGKCCRGGACVALGVCETADSTTGNCTSCISQGACCLHTRCIKSCPGCATCGSNGNCDSCASVGKCCISSAGISICADASQCPSGTCCAGAGDMCCHGATPDCCASGCTDLNSDAHNCKTCGNDCTATALGMACQNGTCMCPGGEQPSNGKCSCTSNIFCKGDCCSGVSPKCCTSGCVDTSSNNQNCGDCGVACTINGTVCKNGECVCSATGILPINGKCGCDQIAETCTAGSCCSGLTCCNGTCADTTSDDNNCGPSCVACTGNNTCQNGTCAICLADGADCSNNIGACCSGVTCPDSGASKNKCCEPQGSTCSTDSECCSGKCQLRNGIKVCTCTGPNGCL